MILFRKVASVSLHHYSLPFIAVIMHGGQKEVPGLGAKLNTSVSALALILGTPPGWGGQRISPGRRRPGGGP